MSPLVHRELRRVAAHGGVRWLRFGVASVALVLWAGVSGLTSFQVAAAAGGTLFAIAKPGLLGIAIFSGLVCTSPSLVQEKAWGTLEILLLTPQRPLQIVLAKLVTGSAAAIQILLSLFPILAVSHVIGGVSGAEFWRLVAATMSLLWFSLAAGILGAVLGRDLWQSSVATFTIIGLPGLLLAYADHWLKSLVPAGSAHSLLPGIVQMAAQINDAEFNLPGNTFWASVLVTNLLAGCFTWIAAWALPSHSLNRPGLSLQDWRERIARRLVLLPGNPEAYRRRCLHARPVLWLLRRRNWRLLSHWLWIGAACGLWLVVAGWMYFRDGSLDYAVLLSLPLILHATLIAACASTAAGLVAYMRQSRELELLMVTPVSVQEFVGSAVHAIRTRLALPVMLVLGVDVALLVGAFQLSSMASSATFWIGPYDPGPQWMFTIPAIRIHAGVLQSVPLCVLIGLLVVQVRSLPWFGLWAGMKYPTVIEAAIQSAVRGAIWPVFLGILTLPLSPLMWGMGLLDRTGNSFLLGGTLWILGFGIGGAKYYELRARRRLEKHFRWAASHQFGFAPRRRWQFPWPAGWS